MVSPMTRGAAAAFLQDLLARPTVPLGRGKKPNRLDVLLKHGLSYALFAAGKHSTFDIHIRCQPRPNEPFDLDTDSEEAILTEEHIELAQRLAGEVAFPDDLQELPD